MKGKVVINGRFPKKVKDALGSPKFARRILVEVMGEILGVENVLDHPAEYYVQAADPAIIVGKPNGVIINLTGVSRNGRTSMQFRKAKDRLHAIGKKTLANALKASEDVSVQIFAVVMLNGDVEVADGVYDSVLESDAEWVTAKS